MPTFSGMQVGHKTRAGCVQDIGLKSLSSTLGVIGKSFGNEISIEGND